LFFLQAFAMLQSGQGRKKLRMVFGSGTTAGSSAISGLTASYLSVVCGVRAVTCTKSARKRVMQLSHLHAATASW
jgi:hypothetical protein